MVAAVATMQEVRCVGIVRDGTHREGKVCNAFLIKVDSEVLRRGVIARMASIKCKCGRYEDFSRFKATS